MSIRIKSGGGTCMHIFENESNFQKKIKACNKSSMEVVLQKQLQH